MYYAEQEIDDVVEGEERTLLKLSDGRTVRLKKELYEVSVTEEPTDLTDLWNRQVSPVVEDILQILLDWDITLSQMDYLVTTLQDSIQNSVNNANDNVWGIDSQERRMSDVDRALQDNDEEE